jgi:hypothetical protein
LKTNGPACSEWKLLKATHKDYVEPTACCCSTGRGPCPRPGVDCVQDKSDITKGTPILSMCRECRIAAFGASYAEKAARTRDFNGRQQSLLAPPESQ